MLPSDPITIAEAIESIAVRQPAAGPRRAKISRRKPPRPPDQKRSGVDNDNLLLGWCPPARRSITTRKQRGIAGRQSTGKEGLELLRGIDKKTGKTLWIAEDGTTAYCTSAFGRRKDGSPAVLTGRGGWHDVPERPVGLSLLSLSPENPGRSIWRWVAPTGVDGKQLDTPGSVAAPTW